MIDPQVAAQSIFVTIESPEPILAYQVELQTQASGKTI